MLTDLILWIGIWSYERDQKLQVKPPIVFGSLKINTMDRVVFNDGPPFSFHIAFTFRCFLDQLPMKILSSLKRKWFLILENDKILFFEEYVPNLLFPKQNESQSPQVDWDFHTGGTAVVASGTLRGCGGGTLRRRPLWLSTLLSTSPWSARTKLGVATAVLVLYQTFQVVSCWLSFVKFWKTGWEPFWWWNRSIEPLVVATTREWSRIWGFLSLSYGDSPKSQQLTTKWWLLYNDPFLFSARSD